jgi:oxygen-independent coproporphyrinogen-3 oxidase
MHGLPEQSVEDAKADLAQAIALSPEHVSWYQLTIEKNTEFYSAPPLLPVEDTLADIQDEGQAMLAQSGYEQYEISAYAKNKKRARHNINYWEFGDYLGIGAGAHGKITQLEQDRIIRLWKTRLPKHYLDAATNNKISTNLGGHQNVFGGGSDILSPQSLPLEFLMNVLRLNDGASANYLIERTGLQLAALEPQWTELEKKGLVNVVDGNLRPTEFGRRFLNRVLEFYTIG